TRDLTERKKSEDLMKAAYEKAVELSQLKSQFVANISHEVRTPMSGVIGLVEMLMFSENIQGDDRQILVQVFESSKRLLGVLNGLLDFSRIETGRADLVLAPFSVGKMIDEVLSLTSMQAAEKCLEIELEIDAQMPDQINLDGEKVTQVLL